MAIEEMILYFAEAADTPHAVVEIYTGVLGLLYEHLGRHRAVIQVGYAHGGYHPAILEEAQQRSVRLSSHNDAFDHPVAREMRTQGYEPIHHGHNVVVKVVLPPHARVSVDSLATALDTTYGLQIFTPAPVGEAK